MKKYIKFINLLKEEVSNIAYQTTNIENMWFEFDSVGKTTIRKVIEFQKTENIFFYNLALGNLTGTTEKEIDDITLSDNGDIKEIFMTVVDVIDIFFTFKPNVFVVFCGNTKQKNDIYNFLVNRYFDYLNKKYKIFGELSGGIYLYDKDRKYDKILLRKK